MKKLYTILVLTLLVFLATNIAFASELVKTDKTEGCMTLEYNQWLYIHEQPRGIEPCLAKLYIKGIFDNSIVFYLTSDTKEPIYVPANGRVTIETTSRTWIIEVFRTSEKTVSFYYTVIKR
jgi:heme/copper-type cytochrome/quinol oxidase subunit 2